MADQEKEVVAPKFVGDRAREKVIPLEWPLEYDGKLYEAVTVRRCTGTEIAEYVVALAGGQSPLFPGLDCPLEVYEALDADDLESVDEVVRDFLPRRFRAASAPTPEASDNTSTKSGTPSAEAAPK